MPNPADKYCLDMGYEIEAVVDPNGGQYSLCVFPDDTSCETWAFLEGRCGRSFSVCALEGMDVITKMNIKNAYSRYTAVCVDDGEEVESVPRMMGLTEIGRGISVEALDRALPPAVSAFSSVKSVTAPLPSVFDWRNENGQDWMTAPKNQSQCGSCWAFAAVGAIEANINISSNNPGLDLDLSEEYLNSDCPAQYAGSCCGGWVDTALQVAVDEGIPDEACMPYDVGYYSTTDCSCDNSVCNTNCRGLPASCGHLVCSDACGDMANRRTTIDSYTRISSIPPNPTDIKNALVNGGVLPATLAMSGTFDASGIYRCTTCWDRNDNATCDPVGQCDQASGRCTDANGASGIDCQFNSDCVEDRNTDGVCDQDDCDVNHAVVLLGYDDNDGYWIVRNSWGNWWNGDGYFNVGYNECHIEASVYSLETGQSSGCTEATAIDLGGTGTNTTVSNNACVMVRDDYPNWWGTRNMLLQNPSPGTYPVPFEWENACSGQNGAQTITGDWQNHILEGTSDQCATLIDLQGDGSGTITLRYYGN